MLTPPPRHAHTVWECVHNCTRLDAQLRRQAELVTLIRGLIRQVHDGPDPGHTRGPWVLCAHPDCRRTLALVR